MWNRGIKNCRKFLSWSQNGQRNEEIDGLEKNKALAAAVVTWFINALPFQTKMSFFINILNKCMERLLQSQHLIKVSNRYDCI